MNVKLKLIAWDSENCANETTRTTLGDPIFDWGEYSDRYQICTGEYLLGIWYQPRARRWVIKRGSIWEDRRNPGCTIGDTYEETTAIELQELIENIGLEIECDDVVKLLKKHLS